MKTKIKILVCLIFASLFFSAGSVAIVKADDIRDYTLPLAVQIGTLTEIKGSDVIVGDCTNDKDLAENKIVPAPQCMKIPWIAQYVGALVRYGFALAAIFSVMMIVLGGIMYILYGAAPTLAAKGKEYIVTAVFGMVILAGSYIILNTINPNLVNLSPVEVEVVATQAVNIEPGGDVWCEDLDPNLYKIEGFDASTAKCGNPPYKVTLKADVPKTATTSAPSQCFSKICDDPLQTCVKDQASKYVCQRALFSGDIVDSDIRFVDWIRVVGVKDGSYSGLSIKYDVGKGKKSYVIPYSDVVQKMMEYGQVLLEIELHDSGQENKKIAGEMVGGGITGAVASWLNDKLAPTVDDDYLVGHTNDSRFKSGERNFTGIWMAICAGYPFTAWPCSAGPGGSCNELKLSQPNGWTYGTGATYWLAQDLVDNGGVRVNIDARFFREDTEMKCSWLSANANGMAANGFPCRREQAEAGEISADLKCIQSGDRIYTWTDGQMASACANEFTLGGGKQCDSGTCSYSNSGASPADCAAPQTNECWGMCQNQAKIYKRLGDFCSATQGCGTTSTPDHTPLFCSSAGRCTLGAWSDPCDSTSANQCNAMQDFYCNTSSSSCSKLHAKAFQNCKADNQQACASGLICRQVNYNHNVAVCPNNGGGDIGYSICLPLGESLCDCDADNQTVECANVPDSFCNESGDNYCSKIIAGARCSEAPLGTGYQCNLQTNVLYRQSLTERYND
jgi:hypothetical protein